MARFFYMCVVRVARYRIASKCFYAFLFRRPRGEKYRNNCVWVEAKAAPGSSIDCKTLGPSSARVDTELRALVNEEHVGLYVGS